MPTQCPVRRSFPFPVSLFPWSSADRRPRRWCLSPAFQRGTLSLSWNFVPTEAGRLLSLFLFSGWPAPLFCAPVNSFVPDIQALIPRRNQPIVSEHSYSQLSDLGIFRFFSILRASRNRRSFVFLFGFSQLLNLWIFELRWTYSLFIISNHCTIGLN